MPDQNQRIAAVFATMNRAAVAEECVRRLLGQTRPVDLIVVADNDSSDDTATRIEKLGGPVEVLRLSRNLGNAGGVREAMEHAFASGADGVWILDDDSLPRQDCLELMLDGGKADQVSHPVQIDPGSGRLAWPIQVRKGNEWELVEDLEALPEGRFVSRASWTGALISREVRDQVGPVMAELFIRGEDEEYPWRIANHGFEFSCVRNAILDHPGPVGMVMWRFFGHRLFIEKGLRGWKLYYKVRNMVWLKKRQSGLIGGWGMAAAYGMALLTNEGFDRDILGTWCRAVRDGLAARLGQVDHSSLPA